MKKIFLLMLLASCIFLTSYAQAQRSITVVQKPYHPEEDAQAKIDSLLVIARKENKNLMIQAGGNWCVWCLAFNSFVNNEKEVKKAIDTNYLYYHLNYSKENKNEAVFNKYAPNGGELGYPFFIILDSKGNVLKIQESGSLEEGRSYNKERVLAFFNVNKPK